MSKLIISLIFFFSILFISNCTFNHSSKNPYSLFTKRVLQTTSTNITTTTISNNIQPYPSNFLQIDSFRTNGGKAAMILVAFIVCIIIIVAVIIIGNKQQIDITRQNHAYKANNDFTQQPPSYGIDFEQPGKPLDYANALIEDAHKQLPKQQQFNYTNPSKNQNQQPEQRLPSPQRHDSQMHSYGQQQQQQQTSPIYNQNQPFPNNSSPKKPIVGEFQALSQSGEKKIHLDDNQENVKVHVEQEYGYGLEDNEGDERHNLSAQKKIDADYPEEIDFQLDAEEIKNPEVMIQYEDGYPEHEQYNE